MGGRLCVLSKAGRSEIGIKKEEKKSKMDSDKGSREEFEGRVSARG